MLLPPLRSLRYHRERALLSQVGLAKRSRVSRSTILKLEDGDHSYPVTGLKLARALGVSVEDLVSKPPREHPNSWAPVDVDAEERESVAA